jgi:hypothetical protein
MKCLLLLLIFTGIGEALIAQEKLLHKTYHPQKSRATIVEFLDELNKRSGIVIEYSSGSFDANKMVRLNGNEITIGSVLQSVLYGQHVKLVEHNNKIILAPSANSFNLDNFLPASYSFYGYVQEDATREPLVSATIYEPASQRGVVSNNQGYFNFVLPAGRHTVEISYGGLQPMTLGIDINSNLRKDISLSGIKDTLATVIVEPEASIKDGAVNIKNSRTYSDGLMNEDDPLQYLYLNPGLQNASYSFSGFQVRGGGTGENLFLLDGNPVYNPTHLLGAISILNPTVMKSMRFYKSDFPARLSGSLSSVLDVYTRQGNMKKWEGEVHAGLLASSLTLEGPLIKNKVAVMISARKNIPLGFYQSLQDGSTSDFYDAHFKISAIVSPKSKFAINFYKGEDQLKQQGKYVNNLQRWGNVVGSLGWNYILGSRSFINTTVNYSHYQNLASFQYTLFDNDEDADDDDDDDDEIEEDLSLETKFIGTYSSIKNYSAKSQAEIYVSKKLKLNTGARLSQTIIKPFESKITNTIEEDEANFILFDALQFEELSFYTEAEIKLGKKLFMKLGIHANAYHLQDYQTVALQPRFFISYRLDASHRVFASYSKMNQFLHLVTSPYAGANRDLWVPSTQNLKSESSEIYNLGYAFHKRSKWGISVDGYYKLLNNVTNYAEGKSTFINSADWEQHIELGKGRTYGVELTLKKISEKLSWQAGYGLSWSWRQFESINNGKEFPYKYDHRHTANFGLTYALSKRMNISGLWSYAAGNVYTQGKLVFTDTLQQVPDDALINDYQFLYHYEENNQYRAKSYQRYDLSIVYHSLKEKRIYSSFKAGVYNINGASDQYSYNLRGSLSSKSIQIKTGTSVFNLIPYLSYTLKF